MRDKCRSRYNTKYVYHTLNVMKNKLEALLSYTHGYSLSITSSSNLIVTQTYTAGCIIPDIAKAKVGHWHSNVISSSNFSHFFHIFQHLHFLERCIRFYVNLLREYKSQQSCLSLVDYSNSSMRFLSCNLIARRSGHSSHWHFNVFSS